MNVMSFNNNFIGTQYQETKTQDISKTSNARTIHVSEAELKEYNKKQITAKIEEILKDYSQNIISNNKIFTQELSQNNHFNKDAYFKNIRATDEGSMLNTLKSGYLDNTKFKNLNNNAYSSTLTTRYGDVEVFLDLYDDNDKLGIGKLENNLSLFGFDSNNDGILDSSDKLFDKLKAKGYDKDGNEKIVKLSNIVSRIDLRQFINTNITNHNQKEREELNHKSIITNNPDLYADVKDVDHRLSYYSSDPNTLFSVENRYEKMSKEDINSFFSKYTQSDGWVDLRYNKIFGKDSSFKNFAYTKIGFDDTARLSEFNPIIEPSKEQKIDENFSYTNYQKDSFMKFYNDYIKESNAYNQTIKNLGNSLKNFDENANEYISKLEDTKSAKMIAMENEFSKATGLEFSISNLKKVKRAFMLNEATAATALQDSDILISMKLNKDGSIRLKFDSGRELDVKELYTDTGKLNIPGDRKLSVNSDAKNMNNIELNRLKFDEVGIRQGKEIVTLKDIGAIAIINLSDKFSSKFLISLSNTKSITTSEIYNISYLENDLKYKEKIDEKDKFYKKIDVMVWFAYDFLQKSLS